MTLQNDLWSARLPNGEIRAGTLEQLGEAFRAGLIGEATPVCAAGSAQWARLADILAAAAGAMAAASPPRAVGGSVPPRSSTAPAPAVATGDLWQVRLASGEVRSGTRQQLEEAIVAGHLTADLLALPSGATSWRALGAVLAGSVSSLPPRPVSVAPSAVAPPPASVAPPAPVGPAVSVAPAAPPSPPLPASDDAWQVRLPDGQIRAGTRAQLEEAVRAGLLDASFMVLAAGAVEWTPLSVAIAPPTPPQAVAPPAEASPAAAQGVAPPAELGPADPETPLAPDTLDSLPGGNPGEDTPVTKATDSAEPLWQVQLPERQLDAAFEAGLIGDDALVMAAGTDQWIRFGDVRRSRERTS
jgi:hypothetical protein